MRNQEERVNSKNWKKEETLESMRKGGVNTKMNEDGGVNTRMDEEGE